MALSFEIYKVLAGSTKKPISDEASKLMKNRSHNKADWVHGMPADEGSVLSSILEPFGTNNAFKSLNNCFPHYVGTLQTASKWHLKLANFKFTLGELRRTNARTLCAPLSEMDGTSMERAR